MFREARKQMQENFERIIQAVETHSVIKVDRVSDK